VRVIGSLLIVGILFSYVPVFPTDDCAEGNHLGNIMKMDCGSLFHCPMIVDLSISATRALPTSGRLVSTQPLLALKELTHAIFHPPKYI